jgi:hypothetical protein
MQKLLLVALCCASVAGAQTVRGTVKADDRLVTGVVVTLVDSAGQTVSRALSDESGSYGLTAPKPGTYRLRTMRIGYRAALSDAFVLTAGESATHPLQLSKVAFVLDTVKSVGKNQCRIAAADSTAVAVPLWDQVRTALMAAQLTLAARTTSFTSISYDRMLGLRSQRVGSQSVDIHTDFAKQPWRALHPDSVRKNGYVYTTADSDRIYYAPDLLTLTSDNFVNDHCIRLSPKSDARRVGIEFEPVGSRKITEIKGTVWLDRKSSELSDLEFSYVHNITAEEERNAGGNVGFARMSNGMWAISRWNIRMPSPHIEPHYDGAFKLIGTERVLDSIKVSGGELVMATMTGNRRDTLWIRPPLILRGTILDSLTGAPVARAVVTLNGTPLSDTTGAGGTFAINGVLPGRYMMTVLTPSLDSVHAVDQHSVFFSDSAAPLSVRVADAALLRRSGAKLVSAFTGVVVDSAGAAIPDAEVQITDLGLSALANSAGAFRVGSVAPGSHPVLVRRPGYGPMETTLDFTAGSVVDRRVVLSKVVTLDSVVTVASADPLMQKFEERRKKGIGTFFTRDDLKLAENNGMRLGALMQKHKEWNILLLGGSEWAEGRPQPGSRCVDTQKAPPRNHVNLDSPFGKCLETEKIFYLPDEGMQLHGVPIACFSQVYLNGSLQNMGRPTPPYDLAQIPLNEIEAVELYVGQRQTPPELVGANSPCGVIVIHTRKKP